MLNIAITIDCDFNGYNPFEGKISFNKKDFDRNLLELILYIQRENIPAFFLIHTSIFIRKEFSNMFYTDAYYKKIWKKLYDTGHAIGLHPHEEEIGGIYYYYYSEYMDRIISGHAELLYDNGINPCSIRFGFFTLAEGTLKSLEKNNILISFDNMGGYLSCTSNHFENAPCAPYFYSYFDKEKAGDSKIFSIPLGMDDSHKLWKGLVPEANSSDEQILLLDWLAKKHADSNSVYNLLIHAYNFLPQNKNITETISYIKKDLRMKIADISAINTLRQNYSML